MGIEKNKDFNNELNEQKCAAQISHSDDAELTVFQSAQELDGIDLEFPIEAFTGSARAAVDAVCEKTQAPVAMCCQGVLAAMSTASSMFGDVKTINNTIMPMALFLMTIAKSGERKSAVDALCNKGIHAFQSQLSKDSKGEKSGDIIFSEPTYEALMENLENGPTIGLLANDDAAGWFSSHSMSRENRGKTLSGLCQLYSGTTLSRPRVTKATKPLIGTSLTMHMMFQPYLLPKVYGDRELRDQGLLPRTLLSFPPTKMGKRPFKVPSEKAETDLELFQRHCFSMLKNLQPHRRTNTEDPFSHVNRVMPLSESAQDILIEFYNEMELSIGRGGEYQSIASFATRATENATRIAAIFTVFEDDKATEVSGKAAKAGIKLARYYTEAAKQVVAQSISGNTLGEADALAQWLLKNIGAGNLCYSQRILRNAPLKYRKTEALRPAIEILKSKGWLIVQEPDLVIDGAARKISYRIHPDAEW